MLLTFHQDFKKHKKNLKTLLISIFLYKKLITFNLLQSNFETFFIYEYKLKIIYKH